MNIPHLYTSEPNTFINLKIYYKF